MCHIDSAVVEKIEILKIEPQYYAIVSAFP